MLSLGFKLTSFVNVDKERWEPLTSLNDALILKMVATL